MKIGIIGAGNIGSALALHFRKHLHTVLMANSRGPETLSEVARSTGVFNVDGKANNHGSETWQRVKAADGWRIASIVYSSERARAAVTVTL